MTTMSFILIFIFFHGVLSLRNNACTKLSHYPIKYFSPYCYYSPNVMTTVPEKLKSNGYGCQTHYVVTNDSYKLTLHRIVGNNGRPNRGLPVYLQHGVMSDSGAFIDPGKRALGYQLFDRGYDVWLGNFRGNRYSRDHLVLKESDSKFWDFSANSFLEFDIPQSIQKVFELTRKKMIYIGHSLGTIMFTCYSAGRPKEANQMVSAVLLLSPAVYLDPALQWKFIFAYGHYLAKLILDLRVTVLFRRGDVVVKILQILCSTMPFVCRQAISFLFGKSDQLLSEDLLNFYSFYSIGTPVKLMNHASQTYNAQGCVKYDYGKNENLKIYGQENPPRMNISKIIIPEFHLYYTNDDAFASRKSATRLFSELQIPRKYMKQVPMYGHDVGHHYGHNDFLWAKSLNTSLYPDIFQVLEGVARNHSH